MSTVLKPHYFAAIIVTTAFLALGWGSHQSYHTHTYHSAEELEVIRLLAGDLPESSNALFAGSGLCSGCHGLDPEGLAFVTPEGWNVNPTDQWRASIMANSAKDPFWRAKVTHETAVNPQHQGVIEHKCTSCHTPLGHFGMLAEDEQALYGFHEAMQDELALDGISCNACHQQSPIGLGSRFTGDLTFVSDTLFGPFGGGKDEEPIFGAPMTNFVGFEPVYGEHMGKSELCAGCHTLITEAINMNGEIESGLYFVEQATYHEWLNSEFASSSPSLRRECQSCHMPKLNTEVVISSGYAFLQPRGPVSNHFMVGSNTFMLEMFKNNIELLGLSATEAQFDTSIAYTLDMLQNQSVLLTVDEAGFTNDTLSFDVRLENLAGHKFPSGYPARRAYIEFIATTDDDEVLFHSGALDEQYEVVGHDPDYEPHYNVIRHEDEVQIYELVIGSTSGEVTTVLLRGAEPLKDNRLVPRGFSMQHPAYDTTSIAGLALNDPNFNVEAGIEGSGTDNVTYRIAMNGYEGNVHVTARLLYQAAPPKWNEEMFAFNTPEIDLFRELYLAQGAAPVLIDEDQITVTVDYITEQQKPTIALFPNPTNDGWVRIKGLPADRRDGRALYAVYSINGRMVASGELRNDNDALHIPGASGSYLISIEWGGQRFTRRVVKL
jgi:hypothetical protein